MSACLHAILRVLSSLGWKYEPEKILPDENRQGAIVREVNHEFNSMTEKSKEKMKRYEKKQKEYTLRVNKILKDHNGRENIHDPIVKQTVAGLVKGRKQIAEYILILQQRDASLFSTGTKFDMASFMTEQNAMIATSMKKLKSCGITDTKKLEKSMLQMENMIEKVDATINAGYENSHQLLDGEALEVKEINLDDYAADLQQIEDEAAIDEVRKGWENAAKPKRKREEQPRREEEPVEYDDYEKAMWEV